MKYFIFCVLFITTTLSAAHLKKDYVFSNEPIDVVIVTHPKDQETLDLCIDGLHQYVDHLGRIIVVSSEPLSDKAEWFDEAQYPFSKADVFLQIGREDPNVAESFFARGGHPVGWYYQQLLKLYAAYVIDGISSNILVIDSDSVFVNPVKFLSENGAGLLCYSESRPTKRHYCQHAERMLPGYKQVYPEINSVNHHMLFQKEILDDLFYEIESYHALPLWKVFCHAVDLTRKWGSGSEYELYYNYALTHCPEVTLRHLKRRASSTLTKLNQYKNEGYEFISFHSYMRK